MTVPLAFVVKPNQVVSAKLLATYERLSARFFSQISRQKKGAYGHFTSVE